MSEAVSGLSPEARESIERTQRQGFTGGVNPWVIALTVTMATFMEVLDTSVANVSLRDIGGSLSATPQEATWVLTSYLVANAMVLPLSGWLSGYLGRKRFYMTCVALFTCSSFLCGLAPSLGALVFFRILQGVGGGMLTPVGTAMLYRAFTPAERARASAIMSIPTMFAPMLGPLFGERRAGECNVVDASQERMQWRKPITMCTKLSPFLQVDA